MALSESRKRLTHTATHLDILYGMSLLVFKLSPFLSGVQLLRTFMDSQNSECARRLRVGGRRSIALIRSGIIARCLASKARETGCDLPHTPCGGSLASR